MFSERSTRTSVLCKGGTFGLCAHRKAAMGKEKKEAFRKPAPILGLAFLALGCTLGTSSLSWFASPQTSASIDGMKGEATGSYFESGNGLSSSPYIIANEKQLYYFNWLQDLGYFNRDTDGDGKINTVYFKIKDGVAELSMSKYCLPPAGTKAYPFVGNFDGNNCVVNGLAISNSISELTSVPSNASINAIKDLYFDELTVKSGASNVLEGFITGYANGQIDDCGIHCGQFAFVNGATGLTSGASTSKDPNSKKETSSS